MTNGMEHAKRSRRQFFRSVSRETAARFFRNVAFGRDHTSRKYTLLVLLCFGLAGVLIDLDHFLIEETQMVRPLHLPYWFGIWVVSLGYYAYLHRRVHRVGVEKDERSETQV